MTDDNRLREVVARKLRGLPAAPTDAEKDATCRTAGCTNDLSVPGHFDGFCSACASRKFRRGDWHTPPMGGPNGPV